jgi:4-aminobutyrate aminotransferase-like enzyme
MPTEQGHRDPADCLAHGDLVYRHDSVPLFVAAQGCQLVDQDGYRYLDAEASSGTAGLGFDAGIISGAANRVASMPVLPAFCESPLRREVAAALAGRLNEATGRTGRIAFELGGAQGVELALNVVRSNTSRSQLAVLEGGYHGRSGLTAQLSAGHRLRRIYGDWRLPVVRLPYPDPDRGPFSQTPAGFAASALAYVRQLTSKEFAGVAMPGREPDVAALIIEPMLNAGGIVRPDPAYLLGVVEIFRAMGALIVVDEVFCGLYRTGPEWGFQHYQGLDPDIVVLGKALTNGITAMTCVWARDPLMDPDHFPPGTHSSTFQTTPLTLAIAAEVLDRYDKWTDRDRQISVVERGLRQVVDRVVAHCPAAVSGWACGGLGRIRLADALAPALAQRAMTIGRDDPVSGVHGLILSAPGMAPDVIGFAPPLVITEAEIEIMQTLLLRLFATL